MATILIVDDNLDAARPLAVLVRHMGHKGVCVDSGEKAIGFIRDSTPDLMILDAMMPGMDGIEVLRLVRSDPKYSKVPIVMFSAISEPAYQAHARLHGATDYWVKASLSLDDLRQRVQFYLSPVPDAPV